MRWVGVAGGVVRGVEGGEFEGSCAREGAGEVGAREGEGEGAVSGVEVVRIGVGFGVVRGGVGHVRFGVRGDGEVRGGL